MKNTVTKEEYYELISRLTAPQFANSGVIQPNDPGHIEDHELIKDHIAGFNSGKAVITIYKVGGGLYFEDLEYNDTMDISEEDVLGLLPDAGHGMPGILTVESREGLSSTEGSQWVDGDSLSFYQIGLYSTFRLLSIEVQGLKHMINDLTTRLEALEGGA